MGKGDYAPCAELARCNALIEEYFKTGQYAECFAGHLALAEQGYPLAECQVGYFCLEGLGTQRDVARAFYWTQRAAGHGDRDAQYNLGLLYESGTGTPPDPRKAEEWYRRAARQGQPEAVRRCRELGEEA